MSGIPQVPQPGMIPQVQQPMQPMQPQPMQPQQMQPMQPMQLQTMQPMQPQTMQPMQPQPQVMQPQVMQPQPMIQQPMIQQQQPVPSQIIGNMNMNGGGSLLNQMDLSNVEEMNFKLLDTNLEHEAMIVEAKMGTSESSGQPKLAITLSVTHPQDGVKVKIWDNITFGENARWKFKSLARACGLLDDTGARFIGSGEQDFVGHVVRFRVMHDEYDGRKNNKVDKGYMAAFETPGLQSQVPINSATANAGYAGGADFQQPTPMQTGQFQTP